MFATLRNAWKIEDIRKRILFTLFILLLFRIGSAIPVPFLNASAMQAFLSDSTTIFSYFNMLTGGAFSQATVFAMSISPYINASIIIQLLTIAIPALERLAKEGEEGKKKLNVYTKILTVVLGLVQGTGYYLFLANNNCVQDPNFFTAAVVVLTFTAGTAVLMWLADQVNSKGIGNGISVILFAGIVARLPVALWSHIMTMKWWSILVFVGMIAITVFVVLFNDAERRIPIQYAKRVSGRKMYGGQSTHLPIKVLLTGVLPIIFASTIVSIPGTIAAFLPEPKEGGFWEGFLKCFEYTHWVYAVLYLLLIIFFSYFYASVQYNPIEITNNIKKNGGFIPGIRPGKPSADFVTKIISKVIIVGALFLGVVAIIPIIFANVTSHFFASAQSLALGGTSLLIVVGVALETVQQIESRMMMRHYKGFLD